MPKKEELEKLKLQGTFRQMDKLMKKQAGMAKELERLTHSNTPSKRGTKRLQCRSYPLDAKILIDGEHTGIVTPHTFEDLEEGKHVIEMHYVDPSTAEVISKKEEVEIKKGHRVVCILDFIEQKNVSRLKKNDRKK